jgi:LemA protein
MENIEIKRYVAAVSVLLVVVSAVWFASSYNALVKKEEAIKTAWSQVESNIQRKADLLPNLVKTVKRYAAHEREIFDNIASVRKAMLQALHEGDVKKVAVWKKKLDESSLKLFALTENYPDLKSSEQFLQLQAQIEGAENRINITRMRFNEAVGEFNRYMRTVPANLIASTVGFKRKAYFKADDKAHRPLNLEL